MSLIFAGIWGTVGSVSAVLAAAFFDKFGRRISCFIAYGIMMTASILLLALWASFEKTGNSNLSLGRGVVFAMFLFSFGYAGEMNTFASTYPGEIMPTSIRAVGVACSYCIFNAIVILLVQVTPLAIAAISWRYFLIFLILDCFFIVFFYFMYPETRNKTLEEIGALFGDEVAETLEEAGKHIDEIGEKGSIHRDKTSDVVVVHYENETANKVQG